MAVCNKLIKQVLISYLIFYQNELITKLEVEKEIKS